MANISRGTRTDLIGTQASPAAIAHGASTNGTMTWLSTSGQFDGTFACDIIIGSSPSAGPTITWAYTIDGTNYHTDTTVTGSTTASTTTTYGYIPPRGVLGVKCTVLNNDTGTVSISAWCEGQILQA